MIPKIRQFYPNFAAAQIERREYCKLGKPLSLNAFRIGTFDVLIS